MQFFYLFFLFNFIYTFFVKFFEFFENINIFEHLICNLIKLLKNLFRFKLFINSWDILIKF